MCWHTSGSPHDAASIYLVNYNAILGDDKEVGEAISGTVTTEPSSGLLINSCIHIHLLSYVHVCMHINM